MPCVGDNLPGSRDQPPPLRSDEEHHDVCQTCEQPREIREKVPVAPETEIFVARQGNRGREGGFLVTRRPEPVLRPFLLRELEPFAAWSTVIVPVKPRMCA